MAASVLLSLPSNMNIDSTPPSAHLDRPISSFSRVAKSKLRIKPSLAIETTASSPIQRPAVRRKLSIAPLSAACLSINPTFSESFPTDAPLSAREDALSHPDRCPYQGGPISILPNLYLGSEFNASNPEVLARYDIKYIINVAAEVRNHLYEPRSKLSSGSSTPSDSSPATSSCSSSTCTPGSSPLAFSFTSSVTDSILTLSMEDRQASQTSSSPKSPATPSVKYSKLTWGHNADNIANDFERAFGIINEARSSNCAILVNCQQGISRSATLIIAYVMHTLRLSWCDAHKFVKDRSPYICPNISLLSQLAEYEKTLDIVRGSNL
ncbi:protein-tyrosine phosphatase-like protein [Polychytrium aggregatum]|uniref:protein-tyrosine phosphatase-like protein n=1 Tax=Polychytrium aggregatum TaxID=110093 RepID=UPI0022FF2E7A|nr:protein-tyrosine phosphatase-like protein [Polychytrium aggregatum]KAI9199567.1 protein-tyrosine phosphatase-like protein [Polychytrium aggregatum]